MGGKTAPGIVCLPNVVVVGAQKSGSTALLGYLSRLSAVVPPQTKEAHFFDRDSAFRQGYAKYFDSMLDPVLLAAAEEDAPASFTRQLAASTVDIASSTVPPDKLQALAGLGPSLADFASAPKSLALFRRQFAVEATPAYMLGTSTPAKMATLIPHARLLVILRNPVDRAYSEWNMKLRRVEAQLDASDPDQLNPVYRGIIKPCFRHPGRDIDYPAFIRAWEAGNETAMAHAAHEHASGQHHSPITVETVSACLRKHLLLDPRVEALVKSPRGLVTSVIPCLVKRQVRGKREVPPFDYQTERPRGVPLPKGVPGDFPDDLAFLTRFMPPAVSKATAAKLQGGLAPNRRLSTPASWLQETVASASRALGLAAHPQPTHVDPISDKARWEPPTQELTGDVEVEPAPRKAARAQKGRTPPTPDAGLAKRCLSFPHLQVETVHPVQGLASEAQRIAKTCVGRDGRVGWGTEGCWANGCTSNIVVDFVARGLYLPQMQALHAVYGRHNVMVLAAEDLQEDDRRPDTLKRVAEFIGLPQPSAGELAEWADAGAMEQQFSALYPSFEKTGWRMHSSYQPMPEDVRRTLHDFYKPHNEALYAYLGRDFGWEAQTLGKLGGA